MNMVIICDLLHEMSESAIVGYEVEHSVNHSSSAKRKNFVLQNHVLLFQLKRYEL